MIEVALGLCKVKSADIGANHNRANYKHMTGRMMSRSVPFWEIFSKRAQKTFVPTLLLFLTSRTSAFISDRLVATVPVDDVLGMKQMLFFSDISL